MSSSDSPCFSESDHQTSETTLENNDLGKELLEASRLGDTSRVSSLMSNGAPLTNDWLGTTPLHLASIYGHTSVVEILIKSGINRDGRNKVDKAPLHFACQHGHFEIVKLLVDNGANINSLDMLKMTPLHWAVEANNYEICLLLLKMGAKTSLQNKFGKTAFQIAKEKSFLSIADLLCVKEMNINASSYQRLDDFASAFSCGNVTSTPSTHISKLIESSSHLQTDKVAHSIYLPASNIHIPFKMPSEIAALSKDSFNPNVLHSGIPVITSQALSMLPPNIQAIPLNVSSTSSNQSLKNTSNVICNSNICCPASQAFTASLAQAVSHSINNYNTQTNVCPPSIIPTAQPSTLLTSNILQEPTVPINIPFSLLTQIIDSGVKLYARQSVSESGMGFVGIDTPMGTIPILPSNQEDGLQLIAVGTESNTPSSLVFPCSHLPSIVDSLPQISHNSTPLHFRSHGFPQYPIGAPMGAPRINTMSNVGFDFPNCTLENKSTLDGSFQLFGNEREKVPSMISYYPACSSNIQLQQVISNQSAPLILHSHSTNIVPIHHSGLFSGQHGTYQLSNNILDQKSIVTQSPTPVFFSNGLCLQPYIKQCCHPILPPIQSLDLSLQNHMRPIYVPVNNSIVNQLSLFPYSGQSIFMPSVYSADFLHQTSSPSVFKSSVSKETSTENVVRVS
ncbi:uncharacterized protein LOC101234786 isoform X2 [Hydra vulgaris]|uniref:uncharacterized protein LOC101234786 isoform X2 n=1 Tax=Hydra vulgaris TaxID=6087 RepID=UPI0032EA2392